jgi:hypothetical protein
VITAYSYASVGNEHFVLRPVSRPGGAIVARTLDDVLEGVMTWPGSVYELRVDPRDALERGPHVLRVRKYEVVRVLPPEKVFGPNAAELDALLAALRTFGWLRPSGEDRRARASVLVAQYYAALGHYGRVGAAGVKIVRDLDDIEPLLDRSRPVVSRENLHARIDAASAATRAATRRMSRQRKEALVRVIGAAAAVRAWDETWKHVAAGRAARLVDMIRSKDAGMLVRGHAAQVVRVVASALDSAREQGWGALAERSAGVSLDAQDPPPPEATIACALAEIPAEWGAAGELLAVSIASMVQHVWLYAWRMATHALWHSAWHCVHRVSGLREPDPWAPAVELFRMGLWPLADDGVDMTVYDPPMTDE